VNKQLPPVAAALGLLGSLACSIAMVIAVAGLIGAGAAASATSAGDMAGMAVTPSAPPQDSSLPQPLLGIVLFLIQAGPVILIVSIAAIALAVGFRRRAALFPVAVAGLVLYWAMYMQEAKLVMYSSVALGLVTLAAASIWSMRAITSVWPRAKIRGSING
jgi:hypothetical protein